MYISLEMIHENYPKTREIIIQIILLWLTLWHASFLNTVGAGSAGCVLANRLSEDPRFSVLLVEAGGSEEDNFVIRVPFGAPDLLNTDVDWAFKTVPQKNACLAMKDKLIGLCSRYVLDHLYTT